MESIVNSSSTSSSNSPPASFDQHQFQTPNSEVCAICCSVLQSESLTDAEELAKLECHHIFHFSCIQAWSEVSSTCPFDRRPFTTLKIAESIDGPTIRIVPIESKVQNVSSTYQNGFSINGETETDGRNLYDSANCVVCGRSDREEVLLLCDDCDDAYHIDCLTPALSTVPHDDWYCPTCSDIYSIAASSLSFPASSSFLSTTFSSPRSKSRRTSSRPQRQQPSSLQRLRQQIRRERYARSINRVRNSGGGFVSGYDSSRGENTRGGNTWGGEIEYFEDDDDDLIFGNMGKVSKRSERYFISNGREIKKADSRSRNLGAKRHSSSSFLNSTSVNRNGSRNTDIADHSRNHDGLISPDRIWRQFEIAKSGLNAYSESNSDSSGNTNSEGTSKIDKGKKRISDDADRGSSTRVLSKKTKTGKIDLHSIDISSPAEGHGLSNHRSSSDEVDDVWSAIDQLPINGPSSNRHLPSNSSSSSSSKPQHNHSSPRLIRQNSVENESVVTAEVIRKIPKFKKSKQNSTEVLSSQNPHSNPSKSTSSSASGTPGAASPEAAVSSSSEFPDSTPNQIQPSNASTKSSNLQSITSTNSVSRSPATTSPQKLKIPSEVLLNLTRRYLDRLYLSQSNCKSSDEKHPVSTVNQESFDRPIVKDESTNRTDSFKTNGIITKPQYKYLCKLIYQKLRTEYACKYGWEVTGEGNELEISSDKRSRDSSKSEDGKTSRKSSSVQEKIAEMDNEEFQRVKRKAMAVVEKFVVQETKLDGNVVREGLKKKK